MSQMALLKQWNIFIQSLYRKIFEGCDHRRVEIFAKVVYTYLTVNDSL